jgi:hypothetical protein
MQLLQILTLGSSNDINATTNNSEVTVLVHAIEITYY